MLLSELQSNGYILAVATGKGRQGLGNNRVHSDFGQYFTISRTADDALSKPSPDMLNQILDELNLSVADVLIVGDTTYDMKMVAAIGMDRISVSFGVHNHAALIQHEPLVIIDSLNELTEYA